METLILLIINSLFIFGVHTLFSEGNLLEGAGKVIERAIGSYWSKPVFTCPLCMASIYGTIGFFAFSHLHFWYWPAYCIALCGLNTIINDLKSKELTIND